MEAFLARKVISSAVEGQAHDALQILSEGHIRCLGMAILLAKIVQDELPFVIFDDIVNAIDDDHRSGILALLFEEDTLRARQLIITTHGEDFIKRLANSVPKRTYKDLVRRIDFLVPIEAKKIEVRPDIPRHYLVLARQRFDEGQIRDSLSYLRKSFEELLHRLWRKIGNRGLDTQIQVSIRRPGQAPDLRSVADGLSKYLGKKDVDVFQEAQSLIDKIRGMEKTNPVEWTYLNKGTHEEDRREEFDRVVVGNILLTLIALDAALEQKLPSPASIPQLSSIIAQSGKTTSPA